MWCQAKRSCLDIIIVICHTHAMMMYVENLKLSLLFRTFRVLSRTAEKKPYAMARITPLDDEDVSVWCSNDYLGMSSHPTVTEAVIGTINRHGVGQ